MKWMGRRQSDNVDDRRGMQTGGELVTGGGIIGVIFIIIQMFAGGDSGKVLNQLQNQIQG